jgi:hypothetical protein
MPSPGCRIASRSVQDHALVEVQEAPGRLPHDLDLEPPRLQLDALRQRRLHQLRLRRGADRAAVAAGERVVDAGHRVEVARMTCSSW